MGSLTSTQTSRLDVSAFVARGFAYVPAYTLTPAQPPAGLSYPPASPHRLTTTRRGPTRPPNPPKGAKLGMVSTRGVHQGRFFAGTGISTRYPSTTPVGLALGPDSPRAD